MSSMLASLRSVLTRAPCLARFIVRDFTYDEEAIETGKSDLVKAEVSEKELWVRLDPLYCSSPDLIFILLCFRLNSYASPESISQRLSKRSFISRSSELSSRVSYVMDFLRITSSL